ncbi:zinc finger (CCCH type) motif-containing protein [Cardiosporidium cionae]|uniref:Zinc finger (CCCH type) motif-containing protein n=1 Tax=Cardiosporidium cionae TaxID=476202 RepID=A0ABQ7J844_9APIC|nr:zinc finger (CCCH type) motif-containing protein [Cardiosporidium cionae]|eukprot:KAF8820163.1 zinc finger (CCCH type) motif-containing protein [Cardiosporidium cionae]
MQIYKTLPQSSFPWRDLLSISSSASDSTHTESSLKDPNLLGIVNNGIYGDPYLESYYSNDDFLFPLLNGSSLDPFHNLGMQDIEQHKSRDECATMGDEESRIGLASSLNNLRMHTRGKNSKFDVGNGFPIPQENARKQFKTRLCHFWKFGNCKRGSLCRWAHGLEEQRSVPNTRKTTICKNWTLGICPFQSDAQRCSFAHGDQDLRKIPGRLFLCGAFQKGDCIREKYCPYAHSIEEVNTPLKHDVLHALQFLSLEDNGMDYYIPNFSIEMKETLSAVKRNIRAPLTVLRMV